MSTATKRLVTRARAEGLVISLVALGYLWYARAIPSLYQMPGVPGPAAFPEVLGGAFLIAGVWRLVFGAPKDEQAEDDEENAEAAAEKAELANAAGGGVKGWIAAHGKFTGMWVVLLGYFVFMPEIGFGIASIAALTAMMWLLGEKRWPVSVGMAVVTTVVLYVAFVYGLGVRLPPGVLSFLGR